MVLAATFGTGQVFLEMLYFFFFIIWIWLLIIVFGDIFRSHDLSGWAKALWVLFVIVLPYLGVFIYLIARGHKMSEHAVQAAPGAGRRSPRLHPGRCRAAQHRRRARSSRRPQGQGRHRRRRVPTAQGQGARGVVSRGRPRAQRGLPTSGGQEGLRSGSGVPAPRSDASRPIARAT